MTEVHVVVPAGVDDPLHPSGGNTYDRRVVAGLSTFGWTVRVHPVPGAWPVPDEAALGELAGVLARVPDGGVVLVDGLLGSVSPGPLGAHGQRLRLVVLVHTPLGHGVPVAGRDLGEVRTAEEKALSAAAALVTTSRWTRDWLVRNYGVPEGRLVVAEPGVDAAPAAPGTPGGSRLLCVGAVTPLKGQDVLVEALGPLAELPWRCVCVGALDVDPEYAAGVRRRAEALASVPTTASGPGTVERIGFPGPLTGEDLDRAYSEADLLVAPSRLETYGMAVSEALARGIPVVASDVGGLPEALGRTPAGVRPGLLVPAGDVTALTEALGRWLGDPVRRQRLRAAALARRAGGLPGWERTVTRVSRLLSEPGP